MSNDQTEFAKLPSQVKHDRMQELCANTMAFLKSEVDPYSDQVTLVHNLFANVVGNFIANVFDEEDHAKECKKFGERIFTVTTIKPGEFRDKY